jgi:hypothetical protein
VVNDDKINNNEPSISKNSIHRVDTNLILKYIGTINQDYGLPNKLQHLKTDIIDKCRRQAR